MLSKLVTHRSPYLRPTFVAACAFSTSNEAKFDIPTTFKTHLIDPPNQTVTATKEELFDFHRLMYGMRRMEITCDLEYKARNIRGFCHLYDGQEACAVGINSATTKDDDWIGTYRIHGIAHVRGVSFVKIFAELFGFKQGIVNGKGGSMHLYNKEQNLYGGAAIVGAQVPVGAGLAFSHKYSGRKNVAIATYGDGTANQGQLWEAANMCALWKLPMIFVCENNMYGMGTSVARSSANTEYYKQGNFIPGIHVDGMDVLAVREATRVAKAHCVSGKGPIFMEVKTYRYHGHSMSDPGISYRTRDEVTEMRKSRDPIEQTKKRIIDAKFGTEQELKDIEKDIRNEVAKALEEAKKGTELPFEEMFKDVYAAEQSDEVGDSDWGRRLKSEIGIVRMPNIEETVKA